MHRAWDSPQTSLFSTTPRGPTLRPISNEESFHQAIKLERRRTERSRKPFLLILLDMSHAIAANNDATRLDSAARAIALGTRETDVLGWYTTGIVLGVMYTEVDIHEKDQVLNAVLGRIRRNLEDAFGSEQFNRIVISFHWFPEEWQQIGSRKPNVPALYPDLEKHDQSRKFYRALKRAMDVGGSLAALLFSGPIFLLIALAIKLTSRGPVFYKQQRVGQFGVPFSLLKFRSMYSGNNNTIHKEYVSQLISGIAEKKVTSNNGQGVYKLTRDPRITSVGAFLRRSSLDELPQFINVLIGEMSLVGPRPPIDYELEQYDLWHRRRIMEAKPGITGLWQVNGRNRIAFDEMVRLDLMYARSWSPWLDLKILLRTPKAVLAGAH